MSDPAELMRQFSGPVLITVGYVAYYYATIINVLRVKTRVFKAYHARQEKFDRYATHDKEMLAADRIQLNTLEHMPAVLVLMWLDAVMVSPVHATWAGGVYLFTRCIYPFVIGGRIGRNVPLRIMPVTFTGYFATGFLAVDLVRAWLAVR